MRKQNHGILDAAMLALVLWWAPGFADRASAQAFTGFEPNHQYVAQIDGQVAEDARLYWSARARSFLLVAPAFNEPALISPSGGRVSTVPVLSLAVQPGGTVDILSGAAITPASTLRMVGGSPTFDLDGHEVTLVTKPDLLGWATPDDFIEYDRQYGIREAAYAVDEAAIAGLRKLPGPARLTVYFGTWCSHCQEKVPLAMKVARALEGSQVEIRFYGLPGDVVSDPLARRLNLRGVPTGVVTRGDVEVGRVQGNGWARPEVTLLNMLR